MEAGDLGHHTMQQFDEELEQIHRKVLQTGGLVEFQLVEALEALSEGEAARAERVIARDVEVNALEVEIDEDCTQVLAKRQPMARDLRFVVAVIKTVTDLERMGDEAVRIARMAVRLAQREPVESHRVEMRHLGGHVRQMLHDALDAFARVDVDLAVRVVGEDRAVDREYESITREMITFMMEDPRSIPRVLEMQWCARALERIGDRACNICEYVIYYVKGKDVRHVSLAQVESEVGKPSE